MELVEDSEGALVFQYRPWALAFLKRIIPLGCPGAWFISTLALFDVFPYSWIVLIVSLWLGMVSLLVTGDMHKDWFWRFDRKTNEAIHYTKRANHFRHINIPMFWSKTGEVRRIKFESITDILLEDRRIYGYPEYRIMMVLDGPPEDDKNREPLIWAYHPNKHIIDWAEKVKATVYGGSSLQV